MLWQFHNPEALWGFAFLLCLIIVMIERSWRYPDTFSLRRFLFFCVGFSCCILGLSRPQIGHLESSTSSYDSRIVLAMDISQSMLAKDVTPSRLELAISIANRLLREMPASKFAIFAFAGNGFFSLPFTSDTLVVSEFLESLSPQLISYPGTDFNRSLSTLFTQLNRIEEKARETNQSLGPLSILLMSDGETHVNISNGVLGAFRKRNIPLFTVGMGTPSGGMIPVEDSFRSRQAILKDSEGRTVITKLVAENLKNLSDATGGNYFLGRLENVPSIRDRILQKSKKSGGQSFQSDSEIFPYLFGIAFLVFLVELLFGRWEYVIRSGSAFVTFRN